MLNFFKAVKLNELILANAWRLLEKNNSFLPYFGQLFTSVGSFVSSKLSPAYIVLLLFIFNTAFFEVLAQSLPSGFSSVSISSGWNQAVGLTFSKDGKSMFVWEKAGKVWVVQNGVKKLLIDISQEVGNWDDHGMLGFALHPQFDVNGYFYLLYVVDRHHLFNFGTASYSATTNDYYKPTVGRIARYTATKSTAGEYTVNVSTRKILLGSTKSNGIPILQISHGVGSLVFGTDGTLLVSCGDGASFTWDPGGTNSYGPQGVIDGIIPSQQEVGAYRSQQLESMNGKILRLDPETGDGIASNPFYQSTIPSSVRSKVWALGLRNPFRMSLRPGTGSTDRTQANPGILYLGDVGWQTWEEVNVVTKPGMNFGWPLFEGLEVRTDYHNFSTVNRYAPNPLYNVNGCSQQYFYFRDLLKQATASGTISFPNPCNTTQQVPSTLNKFIHARPIIDWKHASTGPSRTGSFTGETAIVVNIGAAGSPVSGPQFGGSSATGGVFYTGTDFPAEYRNSYFFGDYGAAWIRNMTMDATNKPVAVRNFIASGTVVVAMATHPTETGLYYINYGAEIRKVYYGASNQPAVAVASVDKTYGVSPLTVQFTGSNSSDPEGLPLTYEWNFGDGTALSTVANPSHTYNAPAGVPTRYNVTLKVKDSNGNTSVNTSLVISVNNTPPVVSIVSPINSSLYSITSNTTYNLKATVTDKEHSPTALSYQWQTVQHHNDHMHPGPIDTNPETTTIIKPEGGCDGETYYFVITLKVTDAAGLSATKMVTLYPDCRNVAMNVANLATTAGNGQVKLSWSNPSSLDQVMIVAKAGSPINGTPSGDGSTYTANLNYTGTSSTFDGGKIVYKGITSPQTIIGLTNNTVYFFKVFTRKGSSWSSGVETNLSPYTTSTITALWNKRYGGNGGDIFTKAIKTADGGYLLGGFSGSPVSNEKSEVRIGGWDYWVVKISSTGVKQWDKTFGGTADDYLNAIVQTPDGGFLLGGNTSSASGGSVSEPNRGVRDYWVVKISSSGVKQWDKRYGGNGTEDLRAMVTTSDGGFLLGGHSASGLSGDKSEANRGDIDYWVVKISSTGVKQWDKTFGSTSRDNFDALITTSDGGYLLGGGNLSAAGGDKTELGRGGNDYWVVKISSSGVKQWDKRFGGSDDDDLYNLIQTSDGGYLLGGRSNSGMGGDKTMISLGSIDYWVIKISNTGIKQWDKRFGSSGLDELRSMIATSDGGFLLAGNSDSGIGGDKTEASRGYIDYWIIKTNSSLDKQWDKRFGGAGKEELRTVLQADDGGYVLAGTTNSTINGDITETSRGYEDYWIVKTNATGGTPSSVQACTASGTILREVWNNITGTTISSIPVNTTPTTTSQLSLLEAPANIADNYGQRIRGYICAPATGNYTFYIAADDNSELYLSTDANPANKRRIASVSGYTNSREWTKYATQKSEAIYLIAEQKYYIEALHKEGSGGDNLAVSWIVPNSTIIAVIPGARLSPFVSTTARMANEEELIEGFNHEINAYPNPFLSEVTIEFTVPQTGEITVEIYNANGSLVKTIFKGKALAGNVYKVKFDASLLSAGLYLAQVRASNYLKYKKLIMAE